jgi:hypothetical protein
MANVLSLQFLVTALASEGTSLHSLGARQAGAFAPSTLARSSVIHKCPSIDDFLTPLNNNSSHSTPTTRPLQVDPYNSAVYTSISVSTMRHSSRVHTPESQDEASDSDGYTPSIAEKTTLRHSSRAHTPDFQDEASSSNGYTPSVVEEPTDERDGLLNSSINTLPVELRLLIFGHLFQRIRKLVIVPKTMAQSDSYRPTASSDGNSLFFTIKCPLARTCYQLNAEYAGGVMAQILSLKVPTLILHVLNFDFSHIIHELFSHFEDRHRQYFNARTGAIKINLKLTDSFFDRSAGEDGRFEWLEEKYNETTGLSEWIAWRAAEESAEREIAVTYKVTRNASVEGEQDREALRLFMLLFDPHSDDSGDVGDIVAAVGRFFTVAKRDQRIF